MPLTLYFRISAATRHGDNAAEVMLPRKSMAFGRVRRMHSSAHLFFQNLVLKKYFQSFVALGLEASHMYEYLYHGHCLFVLSSNSFL